MISYVKIIINNWGYERVSKVVKSKKERELACLIVTQLSGHKSWWRYNSNDSEPLGILYYNHAMIMSKKITKDYRVGEGYI